MTMRTKHNSTSSNKEANIKRASRLKRVLQNTGLCVGSMFFVLIVLEMMLRVAGYGNVEIYQPDPKLMWKLLPNQTCYTKVDHKPVHINSKGTRGKEFDETKPPGVYRILSLGDSRTFGWGLSDRETYSALLQKSLQERLGSTAKIEVINAGVNAWSYAQMYVYLRDVGMKYRPDLVILGEANLWTQFSEGQSNQFVDSMVRRVWLKNLLRRSAMYHYLIEVKLKRYYEKYRTNFIPVDPEKDHLFEDQQKSNPDLFIEDQISKICKLLRVNGTKGLMVYIPEEGSASSPQKSRVYPIKKKISERYNVPLVDLSTDFANSKTKLFLRDDPVHPNVEGNEIIAFQLNQFIIKYLASDETEIQY